MKNFYKLFLTIAILFSSNVFAESRINANVFGVLTSTFPSTVTRDGDIRYNGAGGLRFSLGGVWKQILVANCGAGSISYESPTNEFSCLPIGAANTILTSNGTSPSWVAPSFANLTLSNITGVGISLVPTADITYNLGSNISRYTTTYTTNIDSGASILSLNPFSASDIYAYTDLRMTSSRALKFADTDGTHVTTFSSAANLVADLNFTLPSADGASGAFLQTNGSGLLSFATINTSPSLFGTRGTPIVITAVGGISQAWTTTNFIFIESSGGAVDITAVPQIAAGTVGQTLHVVGRSNVNTVQLDNGTGLSLNGSAILGEDDVITLFYDGTNWTEISRSF
jgi:hypothetical protein